MPQTNEAIDYTAFFANALNQSPFKDAFTKNPFRSMKAPIIDADATAAFHRKNMEALNEAQQATTEAVRSLLEIHTQLSKELIEGFTSYAKVASNISESDNSSAPLDAWTKQCETTAQHGKKMIDTINKTTKKVADTLSNRLNGCLDDVSSSARSCTNVCTPAKQTSAKK